MEKQVKNIIFKFLDKNFPINYQTKNINISFSEGENIHHFIQDIFGLNQHEFIFYEWISNRVGNQFSIGNSQFNLIPCSHPHCNNKIGFNHHFYCDKRTNLSCPYFKIVRNGKEYWRVKH